LEPEDQPDDDFASSDDIRQAIENLSPEDLARIGKAAKYCLLGTEYQDPQELVNEAVLRTMNGATGNGGRHWPKRIAFIAFMIRTIESVASGSRESPDQAETVKLEAMALEGANIDDTLAAHGHSIRSVLQQAVDAQESLEKNTREAAVSKSVDEHFASDDEVGWILLGFKDDMKAAEICDVSGMTTKQYETAHRRFRRGLDKLYPGRRTS
jgi:hypothetical protein